MEHNYANFAIAYKYEFCVCLVLFDPDHGLSERIIAEQFLE